MSEIKIAGFKKQSLIDYPGNISSVVFTQGCNFRCGYCHNPELVLPQKFGSLYNNNQIFEYLLKYKNMLNAVCITGGEPTIHKGLPAFISKIKQLGLKIKLDTNGTNPKMLQQLFNNGMLNFVAMDIKHILNFDDYNKSVGNCIDKVVYKNILFSINIIKNSKVDYEFRTTIVKGLHSVEHIIDLKKQFGNNYQTHNFNSAVVLNPEFNFEPFSEREYGIIQSL